MFRPSTPSLLFRIRQSISSSHQLVTATACEGTGVSSPLCSSTHAKSLVLPSSIVFLRMGIFESSACISPFQYLDGSCRLQAAAQHPSTRTFGNTPTTRKPAPPGQRFNLSFHKIVWANLEFTTGLGVSFWMRNGTLNRLSREDGLSICKVPLHHHGAMPCRASSSTCEVLLGTWIHVTSSPKLEACQDLFITSKNCGRFSTRRRWSVNE